MRNKYGFTLVELLAVIVVLAIIMVIATMSVNKTIIKTRTKAYDQSMDTVVKSAKQILQTGNLDNDTLKSSLDYSTDEYNVDVKKSNDSYLITLTATKTGKFNNMDFDLIDKNKNYFYEDNTVCTLLNDDGTLKKPDKCTSSSDSGISKTCTSFTKKNTYSVGDVISFCNKSTGKSEDFYVIKDNGDTVLALAKYNLMAGNKIIYKSGFSGIESTSELTNSDEDYGIQSEKTMIATLEDGSRATTSYGLIAFANKDENNKNADGNYLGYWANSDESLKTIYNKTGFQVSEFYYTVEVFDENSLLWKPIQYYKNYFKDNLNIDLDMRLITHDELKSLNCYDDYLCENDFINANPYFWTSSSCGGKGVWSAGENMRFTSNSFLGLGGIRPVIEVKKSDL